MLIREDKGNYLYDCHELPQFFLNWQTALTEMMKLSGGRMGDLIRWIGIGSGGNDPGIEPRYLDFTREEEGNTDQDISLLSTCGIRGSQNMPMNLESDEPTPNSEGRRGGKIFCEFQQ